MEDRIILEKSSIIIVGDFYMKERQNKNIIFLNLIYQNAQMGLIGIDTVIKKVENNKIAKLIQEQRKEYEKFLEDAKSILIKYGAKEEEISKLKELSSKAMAEVMTMNKGDKEIAKLMMEGNQKGVLEITAELNQYEGDDEEILSLAKRLLETEEHNREEFKQYL
ncbi:putative uncharacterized protein [Mycoplasma sp. CAG:776]|nr:putative uncharacterized protein [Mycoplasma sp. CAG:776]